jgi:hypothetical protein
MNPSDQRAQEGPYKVILEGRGVLSKWRVTGTDVDPGDGYWHKSEDAQDQADTLNAAYRAGQQDRWISPKERLPIKGQSVIVNVVESAAEDYVTIWTYEPNHRSWSDGTISAWMPAPTPFK